MNISSEMKNYLSFSQEVLDALNNGRAIVALESSIFCHGLPVEQCESTQDAIEDSLRSLNVIPATISVFEGKIVVGTDRSTRKKLIDIRRKNEEQLKKISKRDLAFVLAMKESGGTTVAATSMVASLAGIKVFATGGIGGVHRDFQNTLDISADLKSLANDNILVVCSGIKSILDQKNTLEILEALSVPVYSFQNKSLANFYCQPSNAKNFSIINSSEQVANLLKIRKTLNLKESVLLANALPLKECLENEEFETLLKKGRQQAEIKNIRGKKITPFLLDYVRMATNERSVKANIALVKANAVLAAKIALDLIS